MHLNWIISLNLSFKNGTFSNALKKGGNNSNLWMLIKERFIMSNYHPVSIILSLSTIFEWDFYLQIYQYLMEHSLISKHQCLSTNSQLLVNIISIFATWHPDLSHSLSMIWAVSVVLSCLCYLYLARRAAKENECCIHMLTSCWTWLISKINLIKDSTLLNHIAWIIEWLLKCWSNSFMSWLKFFMS